MTFDSSLLAEALTMEIEAVALKIEAVVVTDCLEEMGGVYKQLRYVSRCLEAVLRPPSQTFEEDVRAVVEQHGIGTNAGGVR